jgi:ribosomal protein S27E
MQQIACPSCGAEVAFRSSASVMAVCDYCRSTLLKDADSVKDIGKMSAVLEDYTPLQINTSGRYKDRGFTLIGRIQLRYDAGLWNEWYLQFDDGGNGWLADASGQYMLTTPVLDVANKPEHPPRFEDLKPGATVFANKRNFIASDVRTAQCTGGEGELPFAVGKGWIAQVADFRDEAAFLTLDYADGFPPAAYTGDMVALKDLNCQLLRPDDEIGKTADKYRGKTMPLACPNCGSGIAYMAGVANYVVCPSCHAQVDCSTGTAVVLEKHAELAALATSLSPGDVGTIGTAKYTVLGLMQCTDDDPEESATWVEYLLFNESKGLTWLVEEDSGWTRVDVLDTWPRLKSATEATHGGATFKQLYDYRSTVLYAAGTFNWQVKVGDSTQITDYGNAVNKLTRETTDAEIVWSKSMPVNAAQLAQWFKDNKHLAAAAAKPAKAAKAAADNATFFRRSGLVMIVILLVLNVPGAVLSGRGWFGTLLGSGLLWLPVWLAGRLSRKG